jgi:hypothetical protein
MTKTAPNDRGYRFVAPRAAARVWQMRGTDPEVRLQQRVRAAEQRFHEQHYQVH